MKKKESGSAKQFGLFLGFGFINAAVYYWTYTLLVFAGLHYILASVIGFVLSVISSFLLNGKFVFKESEDKEKRTWWVVFSKVVTTNVLTGLIINNLLLALWIDIIELSKYLTPLSTAFANAGISLSPEDLAKYIAPLLNLYVTTPINFFINKFWTYRQRNKKLEEQTDE